MTSTRSAEGDGLRIVVSGMMAADPHQGGATWAVLQYVLGLRRLGCEVLFVEPVGEDALRPAGAVLGESENAGYFRRVAGEFDLEEGAALLLAGTSATVGLPYGQLREFAQTADVLLNVSGMLRDDELVGGIPVRVYLDLDPAFNQLWATQGIDAGLNGHTHYATVGLAIGTSACAVPTLGRTWIRTLQPVVLSYWPVAERVVHAALTTVGNWRGYGSIEHEGVHYGQKAHSLRPLLDLPTRTRERFLLALAIHPDETRDVSALAENGWELVNPKEAAGTPARYRDFIQGSKAEFGVGKSGYVVSRCGWFSDRSACYLASGRPVIAQATGFSDFLPVGEGLFAFETTDDVLVAIEELNRDYGRHARAARVLAEDYFDSDKVLTRLLEQIGVA